MAHIADGKVDLMLHMTTFNQCLADMLDFILSALTKISDKLLMDKVLPEFYKAVEIAEGVSNEIFRHSSNATIQLNTLSSVILEIKQGDQKRALVVLQKRVDPSKIDMPPKIVEEDLPKCQTAFQRVIDVCKTVQEEIMNDPDRRDASGATLSLLLKLGIAGVCLIDLMILGGAGTAITTTAVSSAAAVKAATGAALTAKTGASHLVVTAMSTHGNLHAAFLNYAGVSAHGHTAVAHASSAAFSTNASRAVAASTVVGVTALSSKEIIQKARRKLDELENLITELSEKRMVLLRVMQSKANDAIFDLKIISNTVKTVMQDLRKISSSAEDARDFPSAASKLVESEDLVTAQVKDLKKLDDACRRLIDSVNASYEYFKGKHSP